MTKPNPLLWTALLATTASFGSYFFACVFPFAAVSTIAALTLSRGQALGLVTAVWAVNQLVGFGLMDYPQTFNTAALGVVIGFGALAATLVASAVSRGEAIWSARAFIALAAAFAAYEIIQWLGALSLGGDEAFTWQITTGIALNDLGWFLVLSGAYRLLALIWTRPAIAKA